METIIAVVVLALFVGFLAWKISKRSRTPETTPWTAEEFNEALIMVRTKAEETGVQLTDEQITNAAVEYLRGKYSI